MEKEIKRNGWSKFCKSFNQSNQYRHANITATNKNDMATSFTGMPLLGIGLEKKGRLIDSILLYAGQWNPEKILEPILSIKEPNKIILEKAKDGIDCCLAIESKDGSKAQIKLHGEKSATLYRALVEKVAYTIFERRGYSTGNDISDWLEAEQLIKKAELQLAE
jgi:hypothetical protein